MLNDLINFFEDIKQYYIIINRGTKDTIVIKFKDENFFHLVGLHKTQFGRFIPEQIKGRTRQYKYIKAHIDKYEPIFKNQVQEYSSIKLRVSTFNKIKDMFDNNNTALYNLKVRTLDSMYNGDYGLQRIMDKMYHLLGLKEDVIENNIIYCAPQSWMVSRSINKIIYGRNSIYKKDILLLNKEEYNKYLDTLQ